MAHSRRWDWQAAVLLAVLGNVPPRKVVINEMTTIASVWTANRFIDGTAIKGHALGLKIAAGNVPSFVDLQTGGYGATIQDPLNSGQTTTIANFATLADLLAGCATRVKPDASSELFAAAIVAALVGGGFATLGNDVQDHISAGAFLALDREPAVRALLSSAPIASAVTVEFASGAPPACTCPSIRTAAAADSDAPTRRPNARSAATICVCSSLSMHVKSDLLLMSHLHDSIIVGSVPVPHPASPQGQIHEVLQIVALGATPQRCPIFGRGVPKTAIAPTTSNQNGRTPTPGIASSASPGKSSHCRPSTANSSAAVTRSTAHPIGGAKLVKAPTTSDAPAMTKANTSRGTENLRSAGPLPVDRFSNSEGTGWCDISIYFISVAPPTGKHGGARLFPARLTTADLPPRACFHSAFSGFTDRRDKVHRPPP